MNLKTITVRANLRCFVSMAILFLVVFHVSMNVASGLERKTKFWLCLTQVTRSMIDCSQQRHLPCCRVLRNTRRKSSRNIPPEKMAQEFIELLRETTIKTTTRTTTLSTTVFTTILSTTTTTTTTTGKTSMEVVTSPNTTTTTKTITTTTYSIPQTSFTTSTPRVNSELATTFNRKVESVSITPEVASFRQDPIPPKVTKAHFKGGHRRGIPKNKQKTFYKPNRYFGHQFHEVKPHVGYNRALCMKLKVPCRFVNDHACCRFQMPIGLVARARSMDGSADLKWRGYPWPGSHSTGPEARSLFPAPVSSSSHVQYSHATNKRLVRIPEYHYNGSPEVASTLLDNCWRLHYVDCSAQKFQSHPCCRLVTQEESNPISPSDNRLTRWLKLKDVS